MKWEEIIASPDKLYSQFLEVHTFQNGSDEFHNAALWILINPSSPSTLTTFTQTLEGGAGGVDSLAGVARKVFRLRRGCGWGGCGGGTVWRARQRTRVERGGYRTAGWCKALCLHSGGILIWESASSYQERRPGGGTERLVISALAW